MTNQITSDQILRNAGLAAGLMAVGTLAYVDGYKPYSVSLILGGGALAVQGAAYPAYEKASSSWQKTKQWLGGHNWTTHGTAAIAFAAASLTGACVQISHAPLFSPGSLVWSALTAASFYHIYSHAGSFCKQIQEENVIGKSSLNHIDSNSLEIEDKVEVPDGEGKTKYVLTNITFTSARAAYEGVKFIDDERLNNTDLKQVLNTNDADQIRAYGEKHSHLLKEHWKPNSALRSYRTDDYTAIDGVCLDSDDPNRIYERYREILFHKYGVKKDGNEYRTVSRPSQLQLYNWQALLSECGVKGKVPLCFNDKMTHPPIKGIDDTAFIRNLLRTIFYILIPRSRDSHVNFDFPSSRRVTDTTSRQTETPPVIRAD